MSPTTERMIVLRWLMDPRLPQLVVRTFANDLLTRTLKDIQPQISNNIESFLEEINRNEAHANLVQASLVQPCEDEPEILPDLAQIFRVKSDSSQSQYKHKSFGTDGKKISSQ